MMVDAENKDSPIEKISDLYILRQKAKAFSLGTSNLAHIQGGPH